MQNLVEEPLPETQETSELVKKGLEQGELTTIGPNILAILDKPGIKEATGTHAVLEILKYVRSKMHPTKEQLAKEYDLDRNSFYDKRVRSAEELTDARNRLKTNPTQFNISGCIETGHIVRTLLLAKGIPCFYVEGLNKHWYEEHLNTSVAEKKPVKAHVFIDAYLEGEWVTINPEDYPNVIHNHEEYTLHGEEYIFVQKGLDSKDIGLPTMDESNRQLEKFMREKRSEVANGLVQQT